MIYLTGDFHGFLGCSRLKLDNFPQQKEMNKKDYLVILGDFGLVWNNAEWEYNLRKKLSECSFTTLFVDGNHENFDLLRKFPCVDMFGNKVQKIGDSIYRLLRGEVYNIHAHTIFTMGGASSIDRQFRTSGVDWWTEEIPSWFEFEKGMESLNRVGWEVDYIFTHTSPKSIAREMGFKSHFDVVNEYLEVVKEKIKFKKWYFGHYHVDRNLGAFRAMYENIVELGE